MVSVYLSYILALRLAQESEVHLWYDGEASVIVGVCRLHKIAKATDGYDVFELLQIHLALSLQINWVMLPIGQNTHQVLGR